MWSIYKLLVVLLPGRMQSRSIELKVPTTKVGKCKSQIQAVGPVKQTIQAAGLRVFKETNRKSKAMERPNGLYNAITNAIDNRNRANHNLRSPMVLVREDIKGSYHCVHMAELSPRVRRSSVIRTPIRVLKHPRKGQNVESNLVRRPS